MGFFFFFFFFVLFHVYLFLFSSVFIHRFGTLSAFSTFFTLGIFRDFLYHRKERKVLLACILISRTGISSIFFTLRMFRSVTAYAGFCVSFCLLFPRLSTFYAD